VATCSGIRCPGDKAWFSTDMLTLLMGDLISLPLPDEEGIHVD
jgi:hypothetical protein